MFVYFLGFTSCKGSFTEDWDSDSSFYGFIESRLIAIFVFAYGLSNLPSLSTSFTSTLTRLLLPSLPLKLASMFFEIIVSLLSSSSCIGLVLLFALLFNCVGDFLMSLSFRRLLYDISFARIFFSNGMNSLCSSASERVYKGDIVYF